MSDFGFVVFNNIKPKTKENGNKIKSLALKLFDRFIEILFNAGFFKTKFGTGLYLKSRKEALEESPLCFELLETLRAWVIKLPFSAAVYSRLNEELIFKYLAGLCEEKKITGCLVPAAMRNDAEKYGFKLLHSAKNKLLLKSLLVPALEQIYQEMDRRLDQLDMVIVSGNDDEELFSLIRQIEPYISCITVITPNKEEMEKILTEMFADSGLAFVISSEYKNHLKNADLAINLGSPQELSKYRMPKKALVVNLDESDSVMLQGETQVINGISVEIPGPEVKNLMYELHGYYSRAEVYNVIVANKLCLDKYSRYNFETAKAIMNDFKKAGLRISGYLGRRSTLNLDGLIKSLI